MVYQNIGVKGVFGVGVGVGVSIHQHLHLHQSTPIIGVFWLVYTPNTPKKLVF